MTRTVKKIQMSVSLSKSNSKTKDELIGHTMRDFFQIRDENLFRNTKQHDAYVAFNVHVSRGQVQLYTTFVLYSSTLPINYQIKTFCTDAW